MWARLGFMITNMIMESGSANLNRGHCRRGSDPVVNDALADVAFVDHRTYNPS